MNYKLTKHQQQAIETLGQNLVVCAGAGTGKTTVLVERFLKIVSEQRATSSEILAITFTDKAANEMKKRLVRAFQERGLLQARRDIESSYIGTIHAFCSRILKEHPIEAGIDPDFQVIQESEANLLKEKTLDQLIRERFSEKPIFELLRAYTEIRIRKELKVLYEQLIREGDSLETVIQNKKIFDELGIKNDLTRAMQNVSAFERQRPQAEEVIQFLSESQECDWDAIEKLEEFKKRFDRRGKKDRVESDQALLALETYTELQIEKVGVPFRNALGDLLIDFSKRYNQFKKEKACFDFSDLQIRTIRLLSSDHPAGRAVREQHKRQFKFMMVDEFQDVDSLELKLIDLLKSENNLFVVGDFKQSIYGFRGSDPSIFDEIIKRSEKDQASAVISLVDNFRTRPETLEFINQFFNHLWQDKTVSYEEIVAAKSFNDVIETPVDLIRVEKESDESANETRLEEARLIAARIHELIHKEQYKFGDFVLLFRSSNSMPLYEQEFRKAQIPYYVIGGEGFYERPEIRDLLNVLRILENPTKDIPIAAVLRSPLFHLTDDSLFWLSRNAKQLDETISLYQGVFNFESIPELVETEKVKMRKFWQLFNKWLLVKEKISVADLIERILEDTFYDRYVLGLTQGERQFANLRKLVDLARETGLKDPLHLGDFIRLVEGFETHEARESEAQVQAEEGNVVRFLTIHKAKGLEFPCVVLPDLSRGAPPLDRAFILNSTGGLGIKVYEPKTGEFKHSLSYTQFEEEIKLKAKEESKRLLYVAMTRSQERLIFSGTAKKRETDEKKEASSNNWFDWIEQITAEKHLKVHLISEIATIQPRRTRRMLIDYSSIRERVETFEPIELGQNKESESLFLQQLQKPEVRFFERIDLPVSAYHVFLRDLTHEEYRLTYELGAPHQSSDYKNEEQAKQGIAELISPAEFGTILHSVFESLIYKDSMSERELFETVRFYAKRESEIVRENLIQAAQVFIKSKIFSEIKNSRKIYTEIPFSLRLQYGIIYGTLDLLYQTKEGVWVILDYKTSNVGEKAVSQKAIEYQSQMELYALACREILEMTPERATLYFTKPNQTYDFKYQAPDFEGFKQKYEEIQKELIGFRKQKISENV